MVLGVDITSSWLPVVSILIGLTATILAVLISLRSTRETRENFELTSKMLLEVNRLGRVDSSGDSLTRELAARMAEESRPIIVNIRNDTRRSDTEMQDDFGADSGELLREIAHGLNTPLSQVEAAAISLTASLAGPRTSTDVEADLKSLGRIKTSVEVCKAYIAAYREVGHVAGTTKDGISESLEFAVRAAVQIYGANDARVDLPPSLQGYSNTFVLATLLPLIENAFDESSGPIQVQYSVEDDQHVIRVTNDSQKSAIHDEIYDSGFSTKPDHQGLGLSSVKRLVATRGGSVSHRLSPGKITFTVLLPRGE